MKGFNKYFIYILALIGFFVTLFAAVFFYQDTGIKINKAIAISKRMIGFGVEYSSFTANSIDDYIDVIVRGQKYNLGIDKARYPVVNLSVNMEGMGGLNQQRIDRSKRKWVSAQMNVEDNNSIKSRYRVKIRSKGDRALHVSSFETMSFKVDIKGSKRFSGLEEFSIQRPIIRNYGWEMLINSMGTELGIMSPDIIPVNFYFNGNDRGIYFVEEGFGDEFLERRGKKVGPIFSLNEPLGEKFPNVVYEAYGAGKIDNNKHIYDNARIKLLELKKTYDKKEFVLSSYFDIHKWASYYALIDMFASYHGAVPKSVKLYFNPSTQLFEPIMFDNHLGGRGYTKFSLMDFMYSTDYTNCGMACEYPDWFNLFFKDKGFFYLFSNKLISLMSKYEEGYFSGLLRNVELFNNAMYSTFEPADRVFYSGLLPYHFDKNHLSSRIALLRHKLNEYIGMDYRGAIAVDADQFVTSYAHNTILKDLSILNQYCLDYKIDKCANPSVRFLYKHNFSLYGVRYVIPKNTALLLLGNTNIEDAVVTGEDSSSMIIQVGGGFNSRNSKFMSLSNIYTPGTNWSAAINIINSSAILHDVEITDTVGEDAINFVDSKMHSTGYLRFNNIDQDALDADTAQLSFDKLLCIDVGNDCLDTSNSTTVGTDIVGERIGDKLVSIGEMSNATINKSFCTHCGIGVAVKDSSVGEIGAIKFDNTPLDLAVFQKKKIFSSSSLVIHEDLNTSSKVNKLIGLGSKLTISQIEFTGDAKSSDVKNKMYGNEYGRASNR